MASGDIVALIDDDAIAAPNWLNAHLGVYRRKPVVGVGGFARNHDGSLASRVVVCDRFATAREYATERSAMVTQEPGAPRAFSLTGYNATFRKNVVVEIGGFDEMFAYMYEETDLCFRLMDQGYQLGFAPNAWVVHERARSVDRKTDQGPRNMYRSCASFVHFCNRHIPSEALDFLRDKETQLMSKLAGMARAGKLSVTELEARSEEVRRGFSQDRSCRQLMVAMDEGGLAPNFCRFNER
jgi:GT2 family glycosyltransferase